MKNFIFILILIGCFFSCKQDKKMKQELNIKEINIENLKKSNDTIIWFTELCQMTSNFNSSKYTKKQLRDTYKLWFNSYTYIDFNGYPNFELDEKTESIELLESKYLKLKSNLENLEIVDLPFWQNLKEKKLLQLKIYYEFQKTALLAYSNLRILKQTKYNPKAKIYVDALVSGDSMKMIAAWKILNEEKKSNNGSPEYLEQKFQLRIKSPQALEYAKMDLFTFGWSNNANKTCEGCELLERQDLIFEEYKKLFISTNEECDEP